MMATLTDDWAVQLVHAADDLDELVNLIAPRIIDAAGWLPAGENSCGGAGPSGRHGTMMFGASCTIEGLARVECWYGVRVDQRHGISVVPPPSDPCEYGTDDVDPSFAAALMQYDFGGESLTPSEVVDLALQRAMASGLPEAIDVCEDQMLDLLRDRVRRVLAEVDSMDATECVAILVAHGGDGALDN